MMQDQALGISTRLGRRIGRASRVKSLSIRFTADEESALKQLAGSEGGTVREWARAALLRQLQPVQMENALFTELIALRLLMNGVLRALVIGKPISEAQFRNLIDEVKQTKHDTAHDVLLQYQRSVEGAK